jgi:predicted DNA-binding protein with PD1-like motif
VKSAELTLGRTFSVTFEHGEDFFSALREFCAINGVIQGYIPFFIAGMHEIVIVGTCEKVEDRNAPIWSKVYLENVEAVGAGTLAFDEETGQVSPHIHINVGEKTNSALARTSHLVNAIPSERVWPFNVRICPPIRALVPTSLLADRFPSGFFRHHSVNGGHISICAEAQREPCLRSSHARREHPVFRFWGSDTSRVTRGRVEVI